MSFRRLFEVGYCLQLRGSFQFSILFAIGGFFIALDWPVLFIFVCFAASAIYEIERYYLDWLSIFCIANVLLILVHELGHALACRIVGAKVYGVWISYKSGRCHTDFSSNRSKNILICGSGPFANLCVLAIALWVLPEHNSITNDVLDAVWWVLVPVNAFAIIWNLLPRGVGVYGTDGYRILHNLTDYWIPVPLTTNSEGRLG